MSIEDAINGLDGTKLMRIESEFYGEESPRFIYVSIDVHNFVIRQIGLSVHDAALAGNCKALLDDFIEGGLMTVGWDPLDKKSTCIMARTEPVELGIWDFRCLDPRPGIRILGAFADKDVFIALTWDYRENFDGNWPEKIMECAAAWDALFGTLPRKIRGNVNDYISDNAEIV